MSPSRIFSEEYYRDLEAIERSHPWARAMREAEHRLLERFGPAGSRALLDIGCGAGLFAREARTRLRLETVVEGDLALAALRVALSREERTSTQFDSALTPFCDESFDIVVANDILQHLTPDAARQTVVEANRVLRPGGVALARTAGRRGLGRRQHRDAANYRQFSRTALEELLAAEGFEVVFCSPFNWLPGLWADLMALAKPTPVGDTGLGLPPREPRWKAAALSAYWRVERRLVIDGAWRPPGGHSLIVVGRKPPG